MKHYEGMFVLHNRELPEEETASHEDIVRTLVDRSGGETAGTVLWANRKLAYPIQGNQTGSYVLAYFSGEPDICNKLSREVSLSDRCLRHMAFSLDEIPAEDARPGPLSEPTARPARRPGEDDEETPKVEQSEREKKIWEQLDYKDVYVLRRMVTSQGKLFSRVRSNLHARHQRQLRRAVHRARILALLPFVAR